jgi:hypothetical protein
LGIVETKNKKSTKNATNKGVKLLKSIDLATFSWQQQFCLKTKIHEIQNKIKVTRRLRMCALMQEHKSYCFSQSHF